MREKKDMQHKVANFFIKTSFFEKNYIALMIYHIRKGFDMKKL